MKLLAPTLENISAERIQVELVKMLTSDRRYTDSLKTNWNDTYVQSASLWN